MGRRKKDNWKDFDKYFSKELSQKVPLENLKWEIRCLKRDLEKTMDELDFEIINAHLKICDGPVQTFPIEMPQHTVTCSRDNQSTKK